jgi:hypothetical protein
MEKELSSPAAILEPESKERGFERQECIVTYLCGFPTDAWKGGF